MEPASDIQYATPRRNVLLLPLTPVLAVGLGVALSCRYRVHTSSLVYLIPAVVKIATTAICCWWNSEDWLDYLLGYPPSNPIFLRYPVGGVSNWRPSGRRENTGPTNAGNQRTRARGPFIG